MKPTKYLEKNFIRSSSTKAFQGYLKEFFHDPERLERCWTKIFNIRESKILSNLLEGNLSKTVKTGLGTRKLFTSRVCLKTKIWECFQMIRATTIGYIWYFLQYCSHQYWMGSNDYYAWALSTFLAVQLSLNTGDIKYFSLKKFWEHWELNPGR